MQRPLENQQHARDHGLVAAQARHAAFITSELFGKPAFPGNHPLAIIRHSAVRDLARAMGWLGDADTCAVGPAPSETLSRFHDLDYIEALQYADTVGSVARAERERYHFGTLENPLFPGVFARAAATVQGSIEAARLALDGGVAFHPSGGTHHGRPDRACGFCYFNDPVFAIRTLADDGARRVAYVDLDAHHGDGVEAAFVDDDAVTTISIHEADRWPHTGTASDPGRGVYNLPVPRGLIDSELHFLIDRVVMPVIDQRHADALVICCGADCLAGDPLSAMQLTNVALWSTVDRLVNLGLPTVVLGGGGYNPWTLTRYWAGLWALLAHCPIPDSLPADAVEILAAMDCELVDEDERDPAWLRRIADTPYTGPVRDTIQTLVDSNRP